MLRGAALGGAGLAGLAVVACGGSEEDSSASTAGGSTTGATAAADQGQPKRGGTLRYPTPGVAENLDPHISPSGNTAWVVIPIFSQVLKVDPERNGEAVLPDLAERWERPDPTTLVLSIRDGVKFHDGSILTAKDVAASLHRIKNDDKKLKAAPRSTLFDSVQNFQVVDDKTVQITTATPQASLELFLAHGWNCIMPESKTALPELKDGKDAIGSGPFKLESFQVDRGATLVRNPDYYAQGMPYLDKIEVLSMPDPDARVTAFRSGQIDADFNGFSPQARTVTKQDVPGVQFDQVKSSVGGPQFWFHYSTPPMNDPRVRQALQMVLSLEELYAISETDGEMLLPVPMGTTSWALPQDRAAKIPGYAIGKANKEKEIAEAKKLIEAAGATGQEITILGGQGRVLGSKTDDYGVYLARQMNLIGLKGNVDVIEYVTQQQRANRHEFQILAFSSSFPPPDPDGLKNFFAKSGGRNYGSVNDEQINSMLDKQSGIFNEEERKKAVHDVQEIILNSHTGLYFVQNATGESTVPKQPWVRNVYDHWGTARYDGKKLDDAWRAD
ncbi:MAG: ABC transporter substrate-binding protein [Dehalococcoidia bacterium]